ncbi:sodium:calcium antiporter [Halococcus hamelinensis]|uniref:Ca2+/Na+ antiporter n=1 Tax=Halococcus hamelinensis 100A6 TaxID=1132509 RepID=M0M0B4_9EURY|nr:sodium:calcium antiporter [Halococcus hamelinensis]EMA39257.1 Ca2+/Na+ antiporter [Halococcus hamelinensis 100A6]
MFPSPSLPVATVPLDRAGVLVGSFLLLLVGAEVFTNGIEWLGQRLGISESATGSILAALGTALPETLIPVIAILQGGSAADDIGVGAILGAPLLLATVAMFLVGASAYLFAGRRDADEAVRFPPESTERDLSFFLFAYALAVAAAFVPSQPVSMGIAVVLVGLYAVYVYRSVRSGDLADDELDDHYLGRIVERGLEAVGIETERDHASDPHTVLVGLQTLLALGFIVLGARLFVSEIEFFSETVLSVPAAVVSLLLAPLATELPETFNSVLWMARGSDTLALGNITGAMAFQSTIPVTLGLVFTSWDLSFQWGTTGFLNALSAVLALVSGGLVYLRVRSADGRELRPAPFLLGGVLYVGFVAFALYAVLVLGANAA